MFTALQNTTFQVTYPAQSFDNTPFASAGLGSTQSFLHRLGLESPANKPTNSVHFSLPPSGVNQSSTATAEVPEEGVMFNPKFEGAGKLIVRAQTPLLPTCWS